MNDVILYSGGLDSFLVHQKLTSEGKNVRLVYFNIGSKCCSQEIELFRSHDFEQVISEPVEVYDNLRMGFLETSTAFVPNRNILAAVMAHSVTNSDKIWIGGTLSDRVNDNNEKVFSYLSNLLTYMYNKQITITSPFYNDHKCNLIKEYVSTNGWNHYKNSRLAQLALIKATFSCYTPGVKQNVVYTFDDNDNCYGLTKECLECPACFRKCMSLYSGGIFIPMKNTEKSKELVDHYMNEAVEGLKDDNDIMKDRFLATKNYVEKLRNCWEN